MNPEPLSTPWPAPTSLPGVYVFSVRCRQQISRFHWDDHTVRVTAMTAQEALNMTREEFLPNLKRETRLHTTGPRGGRKTLLITLAEIKQAREPKPVQQELPL